MSLFSQDFQVNLPCFLPLPLQKMNVLMFAFHRELLLLLDRQSDHIVFAAHVENRILMYVSHAPSSRVLEFVQESDRADNIKQECCKLCLWIKRLFLTQGLSKSLNISIQFSSLQIRTPHPHPTLQRDFKLLCTKGKKNPAFLFSCTEIALFTINNFSSQWGVLKQGKGHAVRVSASVSLYKPTSLPPEEVSPPRLSQQHH